MAKSKSAVVQPGENLFAALGFTADQAETLRVRADLMDEVRALITAHSLTQGAAAALFQVTQPRISDLVRGKLEKFSIDQLVTMLSRVGVSVAAIAWRKEPYAVALSEVAFDQTCATVALAADSALGFELSSAVIVDSTSTRMEFTAADNPYSLAA